MARESSVPLLFLLKRWSGPESEVPDSISRFRIAFNLFFKNRSWHTTFQMELSASLISKTMNVQAELNSTLKVCASGFV